ncbi:elongation factor P hydroxylase [Thalassolituus oleivorans]|uniref:elongation factor P hydroxylase n=1 Tax=Thalassolituus oleivorans TaxID=187493 RepID=UPI0023F8B575|nr:elongation factor P hydroxylase [Thalassolituus oleivorans]
MPMSNNSVPLHTLPFERDSLAIPLRVLDVQDLIELFDGLFAHSENTRLIAGDNEPEYLPANDECSYHRLIFAHGFYASALHEISHWCIAGKQRRLLVDFGYWYEPDGRSPERQREFEHVEVKPQALEWILSEACGRKFYLSTDNLNGDPVAVAAGIARFRAAVVKQAQNYLANGLPMRASVLKKALLDYYQRHSQFGAHLFAPERI